MSFELTDISENLDIKHRLITYNKHALLDDMCTLWFVFSIVLTLGFIFLRLIFGRVGFSTILFIGTVINKFLKLFLKPHFSPLLFDSLEEGGVNKVNGGRGTDLLLHYIFSFSLWEVCVECTLEVFFYQEHSISSATLWNVQQS